MTAQHIIVICAKHFGCTVKEMFSEKRPIRVANARKATLTLIRSWFEMSHTDAARILRMHHTSVCYAFDTASELAETDPVFRNKIKAIILEITQ